MLLRQLQKAVCVELRRPGVCEGRVGDREQRIAWRLSYTCSLVLRASAVRWEKKVSGTFFWLTCQKKVPDTFFAFSVSTTPRTSITCEPGTLRARQRQQPAAFGEWDGANRKRAKSFTYDSPRRSTRSCFHPDERRVVGLAHLALKRLRPRLNSIVEPTSAAGRCSRPRLRNRRLVPPRRPRSSGRRCSASW